jgi:hypothetical protein
MWPFPFSAGNKKKTPPGIYYFVTMMEGYHFPLEDQWGWLHHLEHHGFVVVTGVLTDKEVEQGNRLFSEKYPTGAPVDEVGFIQDPTFVFSEFAWFTRVRPGVRKAYQLLYSHIGGDLVTCFDRGNAKRPDPGGDGSHWLHVDYPLFDPVAPAVPIYQSFASYTTSTGLRVVPGSHLRLDQTKIQAGDCLESRCSYFQISGDHQTTSVLAPAGSLTLWDSRTIHDGDDSVLTARRCVYLCYVPATWVTRSETLIRRRIFKQGQTSNHWPVRYIGLHYKKEHKWDWRAMVDKYPEIKSLVPL